MASAATADVSSRWGKRHLVFASIVLVNFTIWLDEGIFGALTPYWSADLGLTPSQIGTGSAAYLLTYFLMLFVSGVLCDRFGARPLLAIAIIGCSALSAAMVLVDDYQSLVIRNLAFRDLWEFDPTGKYDQLGWDYVRITDHGEERAQNGFSLIDYYRPVRT